MNLQLVCQIILAILLVSGFFSALHADFNGRAARAPYGFPGAVMTILLIGIIVACYWKAGAFSLLLP